MADALFELLSNVLRDELCVGVRGADFDDGQRNGLADHLFDGHAQTFDLRAALADHDARTGAVDEDADLGAVAFDLDLRDSCGIQGFL